MSGLFGGGGGNSAPATQTVTQQNAVSAYAAPYVENMLGQAQGLTNANMQYQPYQGQRTADFTGLQNQAFQGAQDLGVMGQTTGASQIAGLAGLGALNTQYNPMMARTQNFGMGAADRYMNPYAMSALRPQLEEMQRDTDIRGQGLQAKAVGQGAFGGSRQAIEQAENQRTNAMNQQTAIAQGMNTAYNNAMQQFNADQARQLQAQQMNQGQQQFGANLGLQGLNTALQSAGTLGQLGQNQYAQQTGNINLQNQLGTQQQQQQQNIMNQQYQDYLAQKQNPYNQLSFMQSMLSGLPLQSSTQNVYSNPNMLSQVAGAVGTAYMGNKLLNGASGGLPKDFKQTQRPAGLAELAIHKMA